MERSPARFLAFLLLSVVANYSGQLGRVAWFRAFVDDRSFPVSFGVLSWMHVVLWSFEFLLFLPFGVLIAKLFAASRPILWGLAFGIICGFYRYLRSRDGFAPEADWVEHFWVYGVYFVPAFGAAAGSLVFQLLTSRPASPPVGA